LRHLAVLTIGLSLFLTACADAAIVGASVAAKRPDDSFGVEKPVTVDVSGGTFVRLNLLVDSGIR
jgi:hypothetical protein